MLVSTVKFKFAHNFSQFIPSTDSKLGFLSVGLGCTSKLCGSYSQFTKILGANISIPGLLNFFEFLKKMEN